MTRTSQNLDIERLSRAFPFKNDRNSVAQIIQDECIATNIAHCLDHRGYWTQSKDGKKIDDRVVEYRNDILECLKLRPFGHDESDLNEKLRLSMNGSSDAQGGLKS